MNWSQALKLVNEKVFAQINRRLGDVESEILRGAWQGQTYKQIADVLGYSTSYFTRDAGPKLWKLLSQVLGETVSKTNFRAALERQWIKGQEELKSVNPPLLSLCSHLPIPKHNDWGEVVDVSSFYGRSSELTTLEQWIQTDCCHLIAILGMGGVGKTALAAKIVQRIESKFEAVIWRSLHHVTALETLIEDFFSLLSHQQNERPELGKLMKWLRTSRCLIILDSIETILQPGSISKYLPGYENYGEFFRLVGATVHKSSLILTSREKTFEIAELEGMELGVRTLQLKGSLETAQALIQAQGLSGSAAQRKHLCELYNCNPLLLKIVANSIQELFDGKIAKFLAQNTLVFNGIRRALKQQLDRLSSVEQTIMNHLAIAPKGLTITELTKEIGFAFSRVEVLKGLEALMWRSLIDTTSPTIAQKQSSRYTQPSIVREYIIEQTIRQAS